MDGENYWVNWALVQTESQLGRLCLHSIPSSIIQTFFDFGFAAEACAPWPAGQSGNVGCLGGGISGMLAGFCDASAPGQW